jgi:hypothetical protein
LGALPSMIYTGCWPGLFGLLCFIQCPISDCTCLILLNFVIIHQLLISHSYTETSVDWHWNYRLRAVSSPTVLALNFRIVYTTMYHGDVKHIPWWKDSL